MFAVVLYLHVAASFVERESVAVAVVIVPVGWPLERVGGVVSEGAEEPYEINLSSSDQ